MIGLVVVAHAGLAQELLTAAEMIVGSIEAAAAVGISAGDQVEEIRTAIDAAIARVDGEGVIIMTDMFGGTPSNVSLPFLEEGRVEIVSGVNLPMVVKLAIRDQGGVTPRDLARLLREKGRKSIEVASEVLAARPHGPEGRATS